MADTESIYHPGRHTTIFSDLVVLTVEQKGNISCENYCEYDISWKLIENRDPRLNDKIHLLVNHRTRYPFDVKVKLIAKLHRAHKDADPETRIFPLSMKPDHKAVIELEELNQSDHSHLKSCELISFQLEVFEFDYVSTIFATEPNLEDSSRTHDIVVTVKDRKFYLMASYITAWSDWFSEQIYQRNMSEICLEDDVNPDTFRILLNAIHPNINMKFFEQEMCSVLFLARRYRMSRLVDLCTNRLKNLELYPEADVLTRLKIANECRNTKLKSVCFDAFDQSIDRDNWVQENQATIRKLPAALNLKLIMMVVKNREEIPMDEEDNEEGDDEIDDWGAEPLLDDPARAHNLTLIVEERKFYVIKEEKNQTEIKLEDIDPQEFEALLLYIHPGTYPPIEEYNVLQMLKLADRFEMPTVMSNCATFLKDFYECPSITLMDRLELAEKHNLVSLQVACFQKFGDMSENESRRFRDENRSRIRKLSHNTLKNLLSA